MREPWSIFAERGIGDGPRRLVCASVGSAHRVIACAWVAVVSPAKCARVAIGVIGRNNRCPLSARELLSRQDGHIRDEPALEDMRILILLVVAACVAACAADETLSEATQATTVEDLQMQGYSCSAKQTPGQWTCFKCWPFVDNGRQTTACITYDCHLTPTGTQCQHRSTIVASATLDEDLNYWFEGEAASRSGALQLGTSSTASSGSYLSITGAGEARFDFEAPGDAMVTAWVRVVAPSESANTFYLQVGSTSQQFEVPVSTSWTWVPLQSSHFVGAGAQTLWIYGVEPGVKIDRVLLTNNTDFVPVVHTTQAEAFGWVPPMTTGFVKFPPATYIWVPNGAGTGGLVQLEVPVPYTGNYVVWGRFNAPTVADNSFYVAKWLEPRTTWSVPTTAASGWCWHRAPIVMPLDSSSIVEIAQREDGTKLDKLVFTNDPGFTLVE